MNPQALHLLAEYFKLVMGAERNEINGSSTSL